MAYEVSPRSVLRTEAAASYVGLKAPTLEHLRRVGGGPAFLRIGVRAVGYRVHDLDTWLSSRKRGRRIGD